jgi:hypothetical protein
MGLQEAAVSGAKTITDKKVVISGGLLALALGSGLSATPAEATLITTQLNVNVAAGENYNFGPVGDEFTVKNLGLIGPVLGVELDGNTTSLSKNFVAVGGVKPGTSIVLLDFLHPGSVIDDNLTFDTQGSDFFFSKPANNVVYGLKSVDLTDPFGYVQLDVLGGGDLHLDLFAFQDTPGEPAVVVPEPGTLSLFAAGGVALLAARRRRKQQKPA